LNLQKECEITKFDILIRDGLVVTPMGSMHADIGINDDKIAFIAKGSKNLGMHGKERIDAKGKIVFPGAIDAHVHMELPIAGTYSSDDFRTGSIACAFGGITTMIDFAIPKKEDSISEELSSRKESAKKSIIDYAFHAGITHQRHIREIKKVIEDGINSFKMFTTYPSLMIDDATMYQAFEELAKYDGIATIHAENYGLMSYFISKYIKEGKKHPRYHPLSRPNFVEAESIMRVVEFARAAKNRLYIVHMSTSEGVSIIDRAKRDGVRVFSETCPQYLTLEDSVYSSKECNNYIVCPPIRKKTDNEHLWLGINSGIVDTVGTDHCPFTRAQKWSRDSFDSIPPGLPGVETLLPIMYSEGVAKGKLSLERMVEVISTNPARIFGLDSKGILAPGKDADIVIFDPKVDWKIRYEDLHMNADWSPYEGMKIKGKVHATILRGVPICIDGKLVNSSQGKYISRRKH